MELLLCSFFTSFSSLINLFLSFFLFLLLKKKSKTFSFLFFSLNPTWKRPAPKYLGPFSWVFVRHRQRAAAGLRQFPQPPFSVVRGRGRGGQRQACSRAAAWQHVEPGESLRLLRGTVVWGPPSKQRREPEERGPGGRRFFLLSQPAGERAWLARAEGREGGRPPGIVFFWVVGVVGARREQNLAEDLNFISRHSRRGRRRLVREGIALP